MAGTPTCTSPRVRSRSASGRWAARCARVAWPSCRRPPRSARASCSGRGRAPSGGTGPRRAGAADRRRRAPPGDLRERPLDARDAAAWDVIPVVNENDSTATDEITFGDNDALAAQVAVLSARLLVLLTDQEGLYARSAAGRRRAGGRGERPPPARRAGGRRQRLLLGVGRHALEGGGGGDGERRRRRDGDRPRARDGVVAAAVAGEPVGTRFGADQRPLSSFKLWIRYGKPVRGRLEVDAGARRALSTMAPACSRSGCARWAERSRRATASSSRGRTGRRSRAASAPIRRPSCAAWSGARGSMKRCTEITLCCCERSRHSTPSPPPPAEPPVSWPRSTPPPRTARWSGSPRRSRHGPARSSTPTPSTSPRRRARRRRSSTA